MHNTIKLVLFIVLGLGYSISNIAQPTDDTLQQGPVWSLETCIDTAIANNLQVKQSQLNIRSAQATLLQNKLGMLPNINADVSHSYQYGRSIDPTTNEFVTNTIQTNGFSLNGNFVLFEGLRKMNTLKQSQYNEKAQQSALERVKNTITLSVLNSYLQILLNREQLNIAQAQLSIAERQLNKTKKMVEAGRLAEGELLEIEAQVANEELNVTKAQNQLERAQLQLRQVLRLEPEKQIRVAQPEPSVSPGQLDTLSVQSVYQEAIQSYPSIVKARYEKLSSEKGVDIAQSNYSPQLSVFGRVQTNYSDFRRQPTGVERTGVDTVGFVSTNNAPVYRPSYEVQYSTVPFWNQLGQNLSQSVGLSLSIPIFNGWQTHTAIERAKVDHMRAEYALQQTKQELQQDIQEAFSNAQTARKKYLAAQKNLTARQKAFDYAQKQFDVGAITSIDYVEAKNKLNNAKSELLQAKYDFVFNINILKFYQGQPLNF